MKKSLALFWVFCLTASATPSVVKIDSYVCKSREGITTSGVPVRFKGKSYVLTSSWGILEETNGICHEVTDPDGRVTRASLAAFDWSMGFALLETPQISAEIDLEALTSAIPTAREIETYGPKGIKKGRIIASKSTRHHLASLPYSFEILSDRIDREYVGAPVYGKGLDGIVAGQWIEIVAGTRARIHEWVTHSGDNPRQLIVIPISLIRESLEKGFPRRTTFQTNASKLSDRTEIYTGNYLWKLDCPPDAGAPPSDGIGPIGGADGVGVGGGVEGAQTCTARVTPQSGVSLEPAGFIPATIAPELEKGMIGQAYLSMPFLIHRDAGKHISRVPFFTAPHFFTELAKEKQWVLLPEKAPAHAGPTAYEQMMREVARVKGILLETYPIIAPREDERGDYRYLYTLLVTLESQNWRMLNWFDYSSLVSRVSPSDFAKGVQYEGEELRLYLKRIFENIERLSKAIGIHP